MRTCVTTASSGVFPPAGACAAQRHSPSILTLQRLSVEFSSELSLRAELSSKEEFSPYSIKFAIIFRLSYCWAERGLKIWLAHIFARCPVFLQFLHSTSEATLQSLSVCTVLPQRLHFPPGRMLLPSLSW